MQLSEDGKSWVPINPNSSEHPLNQSNVKVVKKLPSDISLNDSNVTIVKNMPLSNTAASGIQFEFDLRANLTPGPVFDIDGTSISITARPNDLIADAGGNSTTFLANSFITTCLLYTSPSPRDGLLSRMPSSA